MRPAAADLSLTDEEKVRDWVASFVQREIMPPEPGVLRRERADEIGLSPGRLRSPRAAGGALASGR